MLIATVASSKLEIMRKTVCSFKGRFNTISMISSTPIIVEVSNLFNYFNKMDAGSYIGGN